MSGTETGELQDISKTATGAVVVSVVRVGLVLRLHGQQGQVLEHCGPPRVLGFSFISFWKSSSDNDAKRLLSSTSS